MSGQEEVGEPIDILLVEDNPADIRLMREVLKQAKVYNNVHVVPDGVEALAFMRRLPPYENSPTPDLMLLDLNLPRKNGMDVLREVKSDPALRRTPVIMLTSSHAEEDMLHAYDLHANCFITKPVDLDHFIQIIRQFEQFWLTIVTLPGSFTR